ncbi:Armadillo [Cynara cardunculus var. scolymus]|uniref:Armadillo n=1 Tax=Cynara cardunculus var. scolymus TaxID=59895 RepID=A0A103TQ45_CYNCS|nr:Armadillo [Cynara cardunculus var. scolymus]
MSKYSFLDAPGNSAPVNRISNESNNMDDAESTMSMVAQFIEQLHGNMSSPQEKELTTARLLGISKAQKEARSIIGSHPQAMPLFISILRNGSLLAKVNVAATLTALCKDEDLRLKVLLGGCIPPLLSLLKTESIEAKKAAAEVIYEVSSGGLSDDHVGMKIFVTEGVVPTLWEQLNSKNRQDKVVVGFVTGALRNLCGDKDGYWRATLEAGGVDIIVRLLSSDNAAVQSNAASLLARLMLAFDNSMPKIMDSGAIEALLGLLRELAQSPSLFAPVADIIGALAYTLMIFEQNVNPEDEPFDAIKIENILVALLKPRDDNLVQDRILEAMASLYGNDCLSRRLDQSEAKKVLIGLITMASSDMQEYLIYSMISLCCEGVDIWEAIGKREGIQLLISFLGLSSEEHQEYAVWLLAVLTDQIDDSKWAITAAGGIPPLVQLLEMGSQKAKEDAAYVLWNLCCHSEDICACVKSAEAVPAFLWFLRNGGSKGQEASSKALKKLIRKADAASINQLLALLLGDSPKSKAHIIEVLGHVLTMASHSDLVQKGSEAYKGLRSLIQVLNSSSQEAQQHAASVLADLFSNRQDICDSLATDEVVHPCMKLLTSNTQIIATQSARALGALSRPTNTNSKNKMPYIAEGDVKPLIKLAKTSSIDAAETAVSALANLLSDSQIAAEALTEDVVSALTRVLGEGSSKGKKGASRALLHLLKHFPLSDVLTSSSQCRSAILAIVESLNGVDMDGTDAAEALEVVSLLARTKQTLNATYSPWSTLAEVISSLQPLVYYLAEGSPMVQDKAIEILARLCGDQPVVLGDLLAANIRTIGALGNRILKSTSLEVRVGATALLVCASKENRKQTIASLDTSGYLKPVIYGLVDIIKQNSGCYSLEADVRTSRDFANRTAFHEGGEFNVPDPGSLLGSTAAMWLLSILSSVGEKNKHSVVEAGGLEAEFEDAEGIWISALLVAILFQDENVALSTLTMHIIPSLANLLKSEEIFDKFFCAQAMASLVCKGNKEVNLAVANSGAVAGLTTLIGYVEADMPNLVAISDEFSLVRNPDQIVLKHLFAIEEVRNGSTACKTIPLLVDLLRPMPDRPGAPPFAICLLTSIADGSDANKLLMAEAGALDSLTKYLSLSPQDLTEATICELMRVLYSNPALLRYKSAVNSLSQLIAVLRLGSKVSRLSAARALHQLFDAEDIRESESAVHALQPLIDMLNAASEGEQEAALLVLIKLTSTDTAKAAKVLDVKGNPLESSFRILSSSSLVLKSHAAQFCSVLFGNSRVRALPIASRCIEPLVLLMQSEAPSAVESGLCAFEKLLDDEQAASLAADYDVIDLLVGLICGSNHVLIEASIATLIKLGKDRTPRKLDMVNAGVIDNCLALLPSAPSALCSSISELFRILTNSSAISKSATAAKLVEPLFMVLLRPDFCLWGQHSALQTLVNVLEKPQTLATQKLTPTQVIEPLISFLESPSQAIQQLGTELLTHLLAQEHFQQDITTQSAVVPLVQLAGIGILNLQQTAMKALESISLSWPNAVADAGGIYELAKVIIQDDPQPSHALWESAASVLSNVLRFDADYYFRVPLVVLVKMLNSNVESTVAVALDALIFQEKSDASGAKQMSEAGAIDALLDLLRSHQCEEASGRLLEALFNNVRVREMKLCKYAIAPLAQYLLDPQTRSLPGKLLAALALGDLSQHEGLARAKDSASACRALVSLLEDQSTDEMKMVTICALQNFVMHSRTNRRAVAETGGILVIQELLLSPNLEVAGQASLLIKILFSNHTLLEYVSNELIRSLTGGNSGYSSNLVVHKFFIVIEWKVKLWPPNISSSKYDVCYCIAAALERELWATATINEEVLKTIHVIFSNFPKLHVSEAATLCIPHLLTALKSGKEAAQDSVLNTLCLLKRSWTVMPIDVSKSQLVITSEAIPILQMLMKTCPPGFHERADSLLHCLPGCLTVTVKCANNLKQVIGGTNAFCRLKIGQGPFHQTKVVSHNTSPEWKEGFTWAFDVPPKGQKLHIQCLSKNTFGKTSLGVVTIQIDKVVSEGVYSGGFSLRQGHGSNKEGSSRTLEIEITWSNNTSYENMTDRVQV